MSFKLVYLLPSQSKYTMAVLLLLLLLLVVVSVCDGQQSYVNNKQLNCDNTDNITLGFVCNAAAPSCTSYLTFRSTPTYNSPATIAYLLAADASEIAAANNISDVAPLPADTLVLVPVNCSCSGKYQQHNASYVLKELGETYFSVANNTYEALSTCQALMAQNPYNLRHLIPGMKLTVPLRCACPTPSQTAAGVRFLLTYLLRQGNSYESIAAEFSGAGADVRGILEANMLHPIDLIFFFTPILVPLKARPTKENIRAAPPPPQQQPPSPPAIPSSSPPGSSKSVFIGVGVGAAAVLLAAVALVWFFCRRRNKSPPPPPPRPSTPSAAAAAWSEGIRDALETLSIYKLEELEKATNSFAESQRMKGSAAVYLASFNGDDAVVKVMKGDVSREIDALRQINHSRIVRLSGFCLHQGTTYLVYEYAENGSVAEWLRGKGRELDWKQRIQIAYDVADALNYLHNFTNPPYIHKNLTTSNVLLDGNMRAKLTNFGLATAVDLDDDGKITRHVVGAHGYMPPEYLDMGLLSPMLDVYAFGVIMLELLSGREAVTTSDDKDKDEDGDEKDDHHQHQHQHQHQVVLSQSIQGVLSGENVREKLRGFVDPSLGEEYPLELAHSMAQLAATCVAHNAHARPPVSDLFVALSALRSSSLDWDPSLDTSITFSE